MYRPNKNPLLNAFMWRSRSKSIRELITKDSVRQLLRALKNGSPVWYAPDQAYTGKNSVLADFCGVPAMCNPATTQLLKTSRATLVPFLPSRLADDSGYKITFLPIVDTLPTADVVADTTAINAILEQHIRNYPEQYYWVHRRFKGRPAPLPDAYARNQH
jgi:Kdo2-lipid IVA lauroyltransferase/acyltransferase